MPFDAFFLTAVRRELEGSLTGCRIDKVQQPQRDTLILSHYNVNFLYVIYLYARNKQNEKAAY